MKRVVEYHCCLMFITWMEIMFSLPIPKVHEWHFSTTLLVMTWMGCHVVLNRVAESESEVLDGVGVGLLRILGVRVGFFDPTLTPKVQFSNFSTCFACLFLSAAQASSSWSFWPWNFAKVLPMLLGYFFSECLVFCEKVDFFYPLNQNDDLKESELEL